MSWETLAAVAVLNLGTLIVLVKVNGKEINGLRHWRHEWGGRLTAMWYDFEKRQGKHK
jgi:hypothetical protein